MENQIVNTLKSTPNEEILNLLISVINYDHYDVNHEKCIEELKTEILSRMK
jgi:hypothetical protein